MRFPDIRWTRSLPTPLVVSLARFGPCGRMRPGPGTWGAAAGVAVFAVCFRRLSWPGALLLDAVLIAFAVAICGEAEKRLGQKSW
jgi:phosphatidylglycerophosphatase A